MANIFAIKARIRGVESTKKITHSMKLVSTSKLHQNQKLLRDFTAYSDNCREALGLVLSGVREESPLLAARQETGRVCFVAFVGNRSLCGSYNQDVLVELERRLKQQGDDSFSVVVGRWGAETTDAEQYRIRRRFDGVSDVPDVSESTELADYLKELFLSAQADAVELLYQKHSALSQRLESFRLLPVETEGIGKGYRACIFEPDKKTLVDTLTAMYTDACVRRCMLEAKVSEHFARMTAMTSATDNAGELVTKLTLTLNRTRQAKITTEISEIISGAKALQADSDTQ